VLALSACDSTQDLGSASGKPTVQAPSANRPDAGKPDAGTALPDSGIVPNVRKPIDAGSTPACHDSDQDGYFAGECASDDAAQGNGPDCDDDQNLVHPNAPERCNGKDDDCDGKTDEGLDCDISVELEPAEILPGFLSVAVDAKDNVYMAGPYDTNQLLGEMPTLSGMMLPQDRHVVIAAYDAARKLRWVQTIDGVEDWAGPRIAVDGDTLYVLAGSSRAFDVSVQGKSIHVLGWYLAALSTTDGAFEWLTPLTTQKPEEAGNSYGRGIAVGPDGNIFAALTESGGVDAMTAYYGRIASDGTSIWWRSVNATSKGEGAIPGGTEITAAAVSAKGTFYLCGNAYNPIEIGGCMIPNDPVDFAVALDADGKCRWEQHIAGDPTYGGGNEFKAIAAGADDRVVVLGQLTTGASFQGHDLKGTGVEPIGNEYTALVALALDADGQYLWSWQYTPHGDNAGNAVIIDGDSTTYLGVNLGRETGVEPMAWTDVPLGVVVALDADGGERFMRDVPELETWNTSTARALALTSTGDAVIASTARIAYMALSKAKH
jgi:hypothetical protein